MPFTRRRVSRPLQKKYVAWLRLLAGILVGTMAVPIPQVLAEPVARTAIEFVLDFLAPSKKKPQTVISQDFKGPADRAFEVKHLKLCPRKLLLYVGEAFTLVPLPLNRNKEIVHGATLTWDAKEPKFATVSSWGEVSAIAPGHTQVTVDAGTTKAHVDVEVRAGLRPRPTDRRQADLDWDGEHGHDCDDPEAAQLIGPQPNLAAAPSLTTTASAGIHVPHADMDSASDRGERLAQSPLNSSLDRLRVIELHRRRHLR